MSQPNDKSHQNKTPAAKLITKQENHIVKIRGINENDDKDARARAEHDKTQVQQIQKTPDLISKRSD